MIAGIRLVTSSPAWKALEAHYQKVRELHLRKLFADDPKRGERMTIEAVGIYLDYSKNRVTDETLKLLFQLAEECGLGARIEAMFGGEKINNTENRAALHIALRLPKGASMVVDGENVVPRFTRCCVTPPLVATTRPLGNGERASPINRSLTAGP